MCIEHETSRHKAPAGRQVEKQNWLGCTVFH